MVKIYTIVDKNTGLLSSGSSSPTFHKNGKVWRTRGSLNHHLLLFRSLIKRDKSLETKISNWVIVEHDLENPKKEIIGNALDYINYKDKLESVSSTYGRSAAILVDKLEKSSLLSTYRWAAVMVSFRIMDNYDLPKFIKSLGIAPSSFRISSFNDSAAIGFTSKEDLIMFKLSYPGTFNSIDLADASVVDFS